MAPEILQHCVEQLADDLALMSERAINAEADRDSYRMLSQQLLHALHDITIERDRLRVRLHQLLDEFRSRRAEGRIAA